MAKSEATIVEDDLAELPDDRADVIRRVRELVLARLPDGIAQAMNFGMIADDIARFEASWSI